MILVYMTFQTIKMCDMLIAGDLLNFVFYYRCA